MPTGRLIGQPCGTAAALAVAYEQPLREVNPPDIRAHLLDGAAEADDMAERLAAPKHSPDQGQMPQDKGGAA